MRVLVTGSSGMVGSQIVSDLPAPDHVVVDYDLAKGQDILDPAALLDSARGCDAVVHSAALLGLPDQNDSEIMATNLQLSGSHACWCLPRTLLLREERVDSSWNSYCQTSNGEVEPNTRQNHSVRWWRLRMPSTPLGGLRNTRGDHMSKGMPRGLMDRHV